MRTKTTLVVLFTALLFGGLAFSQSILGNMFKLGNVTQSNLPASSSTVTGALIYVTDDAGVHYNNGSAWVPMVDAVNVNNFASSYWFDAGAGYIATNASIAKFDGGIALSVFDSLGTPNTSAPPRGTLRVSGGSTSTSYGPLQFYQTGLDPTTHLTGQIYGSTYTINNGTDGQKQGLNFNVWDGRWVNFAFGATVNEHGANATGVFYVTLAAAGGGGNLGSVGFWKTGGTIDMGAGSTDYFKSNGTGITTPSYWESTRAFTTGPGVSAIGHALTSSITPATLTAANIATATATATTTVLARNSLDFGVLAVGRTGAGAILSSDLRSGADPVDDGVTMSWGPGAIGTTSNLAVRENILCNSSSLTSTNRLAIGSSAGAFATTINTAFTRASAGLLSSDGTPAVAFTACSNAATTPYTSVALGAGMSFCQHVALTTTSNMITWVGLASSIPANNVNTMSSAYVGFLFDSATNANWQWCTHDGSTFSCTATTIAPSTTAGSKLCVVRSGTTAASTHFFINGYYMGTAAATPANGTLLYPLIDFDQTSGTLQGGYISAGRVIYW